MPDPVLPEPPPHWKEILVALKELIIVVGAVVGAAAASVSQCQGKKNGEDIQVVTQKIDSTAAKVDAVETKQDATKVIATKTAQKVGAVNGDK